MTPPEHNPKQTSQAYPTVEEVEKWDDEKLLNWIHQQRPKLLRGETLNKFQDAHIPGVVFLYHAGNVQWFENDCGLPIGPSETLARLAACIKGTETAGIKSKLLSFILRTPHRH